MAFIRSISGLRATLGDDLTPSIIATYATAFAAILPPGPIVVGRDGRPSGVWIEEVVLGALHACGREVRNAGMVPTPTVQLLTEHSDAAGGIIITASHNPAQWNGLKFIDAGGVFLDAEGNARLWAVVDRPTSDIQRPSSDVQRPSEETVVPGTWHLALGTRDMAPGTWHLAPGTMKDAVQLHLDAVLSLHAVQQAPTANGERVVVDAVNASGSVIVPRLLASMGYEPVPLYCDGTGEFPHTPEPLPENLGDLAEAVKAHQAAFGVAVDPDADRLVLIDETGTPIGEERTVALAAQAVYDAGGKGPAVVNYSTSRTIDDVAAHYGEATYRSAVGEINVVRKMQELHAVIGGEGSGGVIYPTCHAGRDSIVGLALISSLLRRTGRSMSEAVAALPQYHMLKSKVTLDDRSKVAPTLERCAALFHDAVISREDGVHASWPDRWVHIRASNTEPIMRIIAEAPTAAEAAALVHRISAVLDA